MGSDAFRILVQGRCSRARRENDRSRVRSPKLALSEVGHRRFHNLERIAGRGVDTYGAAQIDFSIEVFLNGAEAILKQAKRPPATSPVEVYLSCRVRPRPAFDNGPASPA